MSYYEAPLFVPGVISCPAWPDIGTATPIFFWLVAAWQILLYPFTFNLQCFIVLHFKHQ